MGPLLLHHLSGTEFEEDCRACVEKNKPVTTDEGHLFSKAFDDVDWNNTNQWSEKVLSWFDNFQRVLASLSGSPSQYYSEHKDEVDRYVERKKKIKDNSTSREITAPQNIECNLSHSADPLAKHSSALVIVSRNLIYFGAPGTGKSYKLKGEVENRFPSRYERVTFYPTYSYAQFVGCYKPTMRPRSDDYGEEIAYEFVPGPFLRVLVNALNEKSGEDGKKKDWCLVIEEINRANAAAVFGDVFQLLDRDGNGESEYSIAMTEDMKRHLDKALSEDGKKSLQELAGEGNLKIPSNMYIWATMNSADQGVFPMDTAFKRRWEFEYIGIDEGEGDCAEWTIEGQNLNWNKVRRFINDLLALHGVNEDKLIGAHFVKAHDKVVSAKTFASKVLMYLWEDAARMCRRQMFRDLLTYSSLVEKWGNDGIKVFKNDSE